MFQGEDASIKKKEHSISNDMPIGFGLSLAADEKAMEAFAGMSNEEKQVVINQSREQNTKQDMQSFVHRIGSDQSTF